MICPNIATVKENFNPHSLIFIKSYYIPSKGWFYLPRRDIIINSEKGYHIFSAILLEVHKKGTSKKKKKKSDSLIKSKSFNINSFYKSFEPAKIL